MDTVQSTRTAQVSLRDGVAVTLLEEDGWWRFDSWSTAAQRAKDPPTFALQRRFRSPELAAEFFAWLWRAALG